MNSDIFVWLLQDGITNGAIYALLALALLLVFAVTRVIFVPQGELITFAALSLSMLEAGRVPGTIYILAIGGLAAAAIEGLGAARSRAWRRLPRIAALYVVLPIAVALLVAWAAPHGVGEVEQKRNRAQTQQQPHRAGNLLRLQAGQRQRTEGEELALRHEDHARDGEHQHQRQRHQRIDGAAGEPVLGEQDCDLKVHLRCAHTTPPRRFALPRFVSGGGRFLKSRLKGASARPAGALSTAPCRKISVTMSAMFA